MRSEWKVMKRERLIGGFDYVVYRLIDRDEKDWAGNREVATEFMSEEAAMAMARELNENAERAGA